MATARCKVLLPEQQAVLMLIAVMYAAGLCLN